MPDPIRELHKTLLQEGLLEGEAANFDRFEARMAEPENRRQLYDFLAADYPEMVDMEYAAFDSTYAAVKKKRWWPIIARWLFGWPLACRCPDCGRRFTV